MELIDKEALLKAIVGQYGDEWLFVKTIESMPIIQLVNCKDCFHGRELDGEWVCMFRGELVNADGYCYKAERREVGNDNG